MADAKTPPVSTTAPEPSAAAVRSTPTPWARFSQWAAHTGLWRRIAMLIIIAALASGFATYGALTGSISIGLGMQAVPVLLYIDLVLVLLLCVIVIMRVVQLAVERRRGSAGSRLHIKLATMFSVVAVAPAIIVSVFSVLFLNIGLESWFSERVRTALDASLAVAEAYIDEHRKNIRGDALALANDINRSSSVLLQNQARFNRFLETQAAIRVLTEVMVFRPGGKIFGRSGLTFSLLLERIPYRALREVQNGGVFILSSDSDDRVRALTRLKGPADAYLLVGRLVDARVIGYMERTQRAVSEYKRLEGQRSGIQITFGLIFGLVALLLLLASVWVGLSFATRLARPISNLIAAAERIRSGDLAVRVEEGPADDEISSLSRAFNRMTGQLDSQRQELIETNQQLDTRRRFTESVLSGVTAGVIGLDSSSRVELPNPSALTLLSARTSELIGRELAEVVPEMAALMKEAMNRPSRRAEAQVTIIREGRSLNLLVRISAERSTGELEGFVVTFDDITALLAAQRTAAWADVAQRIAHEIKNPLTPIQLSAERIKRKYLKHITSEVDVFTSCIETIERQVGIIGRMIDEFSSFARMPAPVFKSEDAIDLLRQAITLQEVAHPGIEFSVDAPKDPVNLRCDGQQVVQVLTNVLKNAAESIDARDAPESGDPGRIAVTLAATDDHVEIMVLDNGRGLPAGLRERLVEPYVTTRAKGTGLGLAIVQKIMEDHGGELTIEDGAESGALIRLIFPAAGPVTEAKPARHMEPPKVAVHGA
jgi:two-component system nitrogen regulation sensor histidine kinase NtrY